ncbi:MAG: YaiI/YqxD family protein, partial [Paracoccaceae bacterium]
MTKIYVDADACPVKAEVEKTATRHKIPVCVVSNGGIRPSQNPIVTTVAVDHGA